MKTRTQAARVASLPPHTDRSDDLWHVMKKVEAALHRGHGQYIAKEYKAAIRKTESAKRMAEGLGIFGAKYVGGALRMIESCESRLDSIRTAAAARGLATKHEHDPKVQMELNDKRMMLIYQELCKIAREYERDEFRVNAVTGVAHCIEKEYGKGVVRAKDMRRLIGRYGIPVEWDPDNDHIFYVNTKELLRYGLRNDLEIPYIHALLALAQ